MLINQNYIQKLYFFTLNQYKNLTVTSIVTEGASQNSVLQIVDQKLRYNQFIFHYSIKDTEKIKTSLKLGVLFLIGFLICSAMGQNLKIRNLGQLQQSEKILKKEIYVTERNENYYSYEVYEDNGKILIQLIDKEVKEYQFTFESKENKLQFRDAYNRFIVVQEKTSESKSVSYWVLTITKTIQGYSLENFPVSSTLDDSDFQFNDQYFLRGIIEYNQFDQFLYVITQKPTSDYDVYGIDLVKKSQRLVTIGWFLYSKTSKEKIVGGNSRVLVQQTTDQLWFDTKNKRANYSDPTIYDKINASSLTTLPIYSGGSEAYSFLSSYFQYVSLSSDKLNLTTFTFKGYEKTTTVYNERSINSTTPIKIFSDEQSYFLAVGSNDVYASTLEWDCQKNEYKICSSSLAKITCDEKYRTKWLQVFNSVKIVVYSQGRFFMLSQEYFYVFSLTQSYEKLLKQKITSQSDLEIVLLSQIKVYLSAPARR